MKRIFKKTNADGSQEHYEEHDEAPAMHKAKMTEGQAAKMGHKGDTELAHVNPWEEALLKRLGGAGTRNPHTGLKQFYIDPQTQLEMPDPTQSTTGFNPTAWFSGGYRVDPPVASATDLAGIWAPTNTPNGPKPTQPNNTFAPTGQTGTDTSMVQSPPLLPPTPANTMSGLPPTLQPSPAPTNSLNTGQVGGGVAPVREPALINQAQAGTNTPISGSRTSTNQPVTISAAPPPVPGVAPAINPTAGTPEQKYRDWIFDPSGTKFGAKGPPSYADFLQMTSVPQGVQTGSPIGGITGNAVLAAPTAVQGAPYSPNANSWQGIPAADTPARQRTYQQMQQNGLTGGMSYQQFLQDTGGTTTQQVNPVATTTGGIVPTTTQPATIPGVATNGSPVDMFNIPLDIMPTSGSTNVSGGTNTALNMGGSNSQNTSTNQSNQASSNYSGLPGSYQESLLSAIMPQLTNATTNMSKNYDDYTNQALGSYQQMMNAALKKNLPAALANLSNRGILNSTEGQGIMGNVLSSAALDASNKGYTTAMEAAKLKANMPSILAQLADLGKTSYGTSTGTSTGTSSGTSNASNFGTSSGDNYSVGSSYSADPTKMYVVMADLIKSMM